MSSFDVLKSDCYFILLGPDLDFMGSGETAFEMPLRYAANSNIAGKITYFRMS